MSTKSLAMTITGTGVDGQYKRDSLQSFVMFHLTNMKNRYAFKVENKMLTRLHIFLLVFIRVLNALSPEEQFVRNAIEVSNFLRARTRGMVEMTDGHIENYWPKYVKTVGVHSDPAIFIGKCADGMQNDRKITAFIIDYHMREYTIRNQRSKRSQKRVQLEWAFVKFYPECCALNRTFGLEVKWKNAHECHRDEKLTLIRHFLERYHTSHGH